MSRDSGTSIPYSSSFLVDMVFVFIFHLGIFLILYASRKGSSILSYKRSYMLQISVYTCF